jgi:hypothetical protein
MRSATFCHCLRSDVVLIAILLLASLLIASFCTTPPTKEMCWGAGGMVVEVWLWVLVAMGTQIQA